MRKVSLSVAGLVAIWACTAAAIQPPRVIELTDGTIPFHDPVWSPDGRRIVATSPQGLFMIEARLGAQPKELSNLGFGEIVWLSDSEFVANRIEDVPGHRFRHALRVFRLDTLGKQRVVYDGIVRPSIFATASGAVIFDSADVQIGYRGGKPAATIDKSQELILVNHYPQTWTEKGPLHQDTDLWLESIDGQVKQRVQKEEMFAQARISGNGARIVGVTVGREILVIAFDGSVIARIAALNSQDTEDLSHWVADPDLSSNNDLLLFVRGVDSDKRQCELGADLYVYDLRAGSEAQVTFGLSTSYERPRFNALGTMAVCQAKGKLFLIAF